jgi:hypothetical protein
MAARPCHEAAPTGQGEAPPLRNTGWGGQSPPANLLRYNMIPNRHHHACVRPRRPPPPPPPITQERGGRRAAAQGSRRAPHKHRNLCFGVPNHPCGDETFNSWWRNRGDRLAELAELADTPHFSSSRRTYDSRARLRALEALQHRGFSIVPLASTMSCFRCAGSAPGHVGRANGAPVILLHTLNKSGAGGRCPRSQALGSLFLFGLSPLAPTDAPRPKATVR